MWWGEQWKPYLRFHRRLATSFPLSQAACSALSRNSCSLILHVNWPFWVEWYTVKGTFMEAFYPYIDVHVLEFSVLSSAGSCQASGCDLGHNQDDFSHPFIIMVIPTGREDKDSPQLKRKKGETWLSLGFCNFSCNRRTLDCIPILGGVYVGGSLVTLS